MILVAELISPSVVTNFNKYGEDVLSITGAVTNRYASIRAALAAARPGDTVSLVANVCETITLGGEGSAFDDAAVNGFGYGLRSTGDAELVERVFEMVFERVDAHAGELGDLVVAVAF